MRFACKLLGVGLLFSSLMVSAVAVSPFARTGALPAADPLIPFQPLPAPPRQVRPAADTALNAVHPGTPGAALIVPENRRSVRFALLGDTGGQPLGEAVHTINLLRPELTFTMGNQIT